ncbi:MAG: zinc ABC transporter substrate-binding protein [Sulfurimonas sp.]|nr:zinc ABC transporter substrate-binding protein [Sulfurimonas sp.]MDD3060459.1 zinc ABC transporter substrate-binding protein [Sulfurimonas sp.]MDD5203524.1 zinc ABC transporter substrate-binding protein [Sulfurimonas sp.]
MLRFLTFFLLLIASSLLAKPIVAVSILPQQTFVQKIAGEHIDVLLMVMPGNSPHSYEPKPAQMMALSQAALYLSIGVEFEEAWLGRFASQNKNMRIIDISEKIEKIAHHEHHEAKHKEDGGDPHTWTSPNNVKVMAHAIYEALVSIDKKHEAQYKKNLDTFLEEIARTQTQIHEILRNKPKTASFLVFHPSWGYFAHEFGLEQVTIEIEGKEPKPKEIIEILKKSKEEKIHVIFAQPEFSDKSAKIIAKEGDLRVVKISPLSPEWSSNLIKMAQAIADK